MRSFIIFILFAFALVSCSPVVETSEEFVIDGNFDLEKSVEYLDKIIDHDAQNADALYQRATLELQLSRTLKAKEDVMAALNIEPKNFHYLTLKAKIDAALGQYAEAIQTIDAMVKEGGLQTVENKIFATDLYLRINDVNKAEYFIQQAAIEAPDMQEVVYQRARLYVIKLDTTKALNYFKQVLRKDSLHQGSLLGVSEIFLHKGLTDSSLYFLGKVRNKENALFNTLAAKGLERTGKVDSATKFWGKVLLLMPRNAEAHYALGKYYYQRGAFQNASAHFAAVSENERKSFKDFYLLYSKTSFQLADTARAHSLYQKAIQLDSTLVHKEKKKSKAPKRIIHKDTIH